MRLFLALALLSACGTESGSDAANSMDAEPDAGAIRDASDPADAGAMDASPMDADPMDAEPLDSAPADTGAPQDQIPPTTAAELRPWLQAATYTSWAAESGPHDSTGPHFGNVRTFINTALDESLAAGNTEHPMGAAAVKELYGSNGNTIRGWSVMVKTESGSGGARWWWYERYDTSTYASSQGDGQCVPCHSAGTDFFLSPYPLQ